MDTGLSSKKKNLSLHLSDLSEHIPVPSLVKNQAINHLIYLFTCNLALSRGIEIKQINFQLENIFYNKLYCNVITPQLANYNKFFIKNL